MRVLTRLAWEVVQLRAMEKKAAKRNRASSGIGDCFPLSEALASLAGSAERPGKFLQDEPGPDG
jgi:hypothetical protein